MMNCEEFSRYIDDYMENNLSDEMKKAMENHMSSCDKCRADFEFSKRIADSLHNMTDKINAPEDFLEKLNKRIDSEKSASEKRFIPDWRMFTGLAAAVVFALVVANTDIPHIGEKNNKEMTGNKSLLIENKTMDSTDISDNSESSDNSDITVAVNDAMPENIPENNQPLFPGANTENIDDSSNTTKSADTHISSDADIQKKSENTFDNGNSYSQANIITKRNTMQNNESNQNTQAEQASAENDNTAEKQIPTKEKQSDTPDAAYNANPITNYDDEVSAENNAAPPSSRQNNELPSRTRGADKSDDDRKKSTAYDTADTALSAPAAIPFSNNSNTDTDTEPEGSEIRRTTGYAMKNGNESKESYPSGMEYSPASGGGSATNAIPSSASSSGGASSGGSIGGSSATSTSLTANISAQYSISVSDIDEARRILSKYSVKSGSNYIIDRSDINAFYSALSDSGIKYSVSKEYDNGGNKIILKLN